MRRFRLVAVLAALVLGVGASAAACDDDGDDGDDAQDIEVRDDDDGATDGPTDDTGEPDDDGDGDQQLAEDVILTEDDVPSGYEEVEPEDEPVAPGIVDCADDAEVAEVLEGEPPSAESEFEGPEQAQSISSGAGVLDDEELAQSVFDVFTSDCAGEAISDVFNEELEQNEEAVSFGVARESLPDLPEVADGVGGFRFTVSLETETDAAEIVVDYVVIVGGRVVATLGVQNPTSPFDPDERDELLEVIGDRLDAAA